MNTIPSISDQIDENTIFKIINKNFSKLAPSYYSILVNWLIRSYKVFNNIDKFIILIYLINKDLIFFRKNGIVIDFETFYESSKLEIDKINISDISKDLHIPKESVRRKIQELEKKGIIQKTGKKILIDRSGFQTTQPSDTLKEIVIFLNKFNKILVEEKITSTYFEADEITSSMKKNFTFCAYQYFKFIFIFTTRWRKEVGDLETFCIGLIVMLNAADRKDFRVKELNIKSYQKNVQGSDIRGVNAMSISEITGIPRPTVVRKLNYLIKNGFLSINEKKLVSVNIKGVALKKSVKIQDLNIYSFSQFIHRVFNQIKILNTSNSKNNDENFVPSYLK